MEYKIHTEIAQSKTIQRLKDILAVEIITQEADKIRIEQESYNRGVADAKNWIKEFVINKPYKNVTLIKTDLKEFVESK